MDKVIFLDRDGTINIEKQYLYKIEDFEFIDGVIEAIRLLNINGYKVIVITNQAGVARGYYSANDVENLHNYINEELKKNNAYIDDFYYCVHHPSEGIGKYKIDCKCRKPKTGLFMQAEQKYEVDKSESWMIGDNISDIIAGNNYGIKTILVGTGYGQDIHKKNQENPVYNYYSDNLLKSVMQCVLSKGERN